MDWQHNENDRKIPAMNSFDLDSTWDEPRKKYSRDNGGKERTDMGDT